MGTFMYLIKNKVGLNQSLGNNRNLMNLMYPFLAGYLFVCIQVGSLFEYATSQVVLGQNESHLLGYGTVLYVYVHEVM